VASQLWRRRIRCEDRKDSLETVGEKNWQGQPMQAGPANGRSFEAVGQTGELRHARCRDVNGSDFSSA